MAQSVIVYAGRSAIGKLGGALSQKPAPRIGAALVKDALNAMKIDPKIVDEIIMGQVLTAGVGQAPARQASIYGGLPNSVCATTINRVCGSGLKAVMLADQAIRSSESRFLFAGGQETMSLAPHLLMNSRQGYKFGAIEAKDSMQWDGLWDPYNNVAMGNCGDVCAKEYKFSREQQDDYALESYARARKGAESGHFKKEIVPVEVTQGKSTIMFQEDEGPFAVDLAKIRGLKPAFDKEGSVTAGNASSINDGAALLAVVSEDFARELGLKVLARVVAQASVAQDPVWFTTAPVACIRKVLSKADLKTSDIKHFEINEAFAVVPMAATKDLGLDSALVNPLGGAVALGHPIGASGARILVTMIHGLQRAGGGYGLATLCIGGGEASAVVLKV